MRIPPLKCLPCLLVLLICCDRSESLFFAGPRKAIWTLIETLGGHKQAKPIHHYHMHYYPVPVPLFVPKHPPPPPPPPPQKIEIELSGLHHGSHHGPPSYGWPGDDYGKIHEPEILEDPWSGPKYPDVWHDSSSLVEQKSSYGSAWDNNLLEDKDHAYKEVKAKGISLQVPLKQQIVFYQPPAKDTKQSLLSILFKKIRRINDALFHPEDEDEHQKEHQQHLHLHDEAPHVSNSVTYAHV